MCRTWTTYKDMHVEEIGQVYNEKTVQMFVVDTSKEGAAKLRFRHRLHSIRIFDFLIQTYLLFRLSCRRILSLN